MQSWRLAFLAAAACFFAARSSLSLAFSSGVMPFRFAARSSLSLAFSCGVMSLNFVFAAGVVAAGGGAWVCDWASCIPPKPTARTAAIKARVRRDMTTLRGLREIVIVVKALCTQHEDGAMTAPRLRQ